MDGEIITNAEMRKAMEHANTVRRVLSNHPNLAADLEPVRDFLDTVAWKGAGR